ncbi:NAD(P)/FAD-dependent oxidoreductase [Geosporobacter ferrireducens]|uniref:NAD(P)/FAD-dependent oxidoreductase n=1 Tax=Geosporobacter ferrireducens TaxID=1424294 RepID=UPI000A72E9A6|nr:FAD-dependent oxidoreductase [Geosporobacter ferrireducens]MTI58134.1 FAD-dependent oxidoreductase [Geosporobacter ferrireducens]
MLKYDIVVIGGGPAGLAAAIEAKKNGVDHILVLERDRELGGILQQCIHNGFGLHIFKEELTGPEYAQRFIEELHDLGIDYRLDTMVLDIQDDRSINAINTTDGFMQIQAAAIILSMGCRERTRGAINIPGTRPAGVYSAGTAQRFVNMEGYMVGKKIVILGSGDIGLIMARRLTLEGAEVKAVAELMPYSGGLTRNIVQCLEDFDIPLYLSHTLIDIQGKDRVEGVTIAKVDENRRPIAGTEMYYECDTLLLSVGLIPENELSKSAGIQLDGITGGPVVNEAMETSVEGIFACGNVVHVHDLVDWVTEESRKAGKNAARYVKKELTTEGITVKTQPGKGIRYIVPHTLRLNNIEDSVDLMMRVDDIYHDVKMIVSVDGEPIKTMKKRHLAPGEMESVKVSLKELIDRKGAVISVAIEKEGA